MKLIKHHIIFRSISSLLIVAFVALDISWAYPNTPLDSHTLAIQTIAERHTASSSGVDLVGSVVSIAKSLLDDSLPIEHLESTLTGELGAKLGGIDLSKAVFKDGVVSVPWVWRSRRYVIQIALREGPSAARLMGYKLNISDRYAVTLLPEDYEEEVEVLEDEVMRQAARQKQELNSALIVIYELMKGGVLGEDLVRAIGRREDLKGNRSIKWLDLEAATYDPARQEVMVPYLVDPLKRVGYEMRVRPASGTALSISAARIDLKDAEDRVTKYFEDERNGKAVQEDIGIGGDRVKEIVAEATSQLKKDARGKNVARADQLIKISNAGRLFVIGDIHRDIKRLDLVLAKIFESIGGKEKLRGSDIHIFFTGDVMDGNLVCANSFERYKRDGVTGVKILLKVAQMISEFPENVHYLAGNGEFGFAEKGGSAGWRACIKKVYGDGAFKVAVDFLAALPMFAVVEGANGRKILLSHGFNVYKDKAATTQIGSPGDLSSFTSAIPPMPNRDLLGKKEELFSATSFARTAKNKGMSAADRSRLVNGVLDSVGVNMAVFGHIHAFDTTEEGEFKALELTEPEPVEEAFASGFNGRLVVLNSFGSKAPVYLDMDLATDGLPAKIAHPIDGAPTPRASASGLEVAAKQAAEVPSLSATGAAAETAAVAKDLGARKRPSFRPTLSGIIIRTLFIIIIPFLTATVVMAQEARPAGQATVAQQAPPAQTKEMIEKLISDLTNDRLREEQFWRVRQPARDALVKIGKEAVQPLIGALKAKDPISRGLAARALGDIGDEGAIPALAEALKDESGGVIELVAEALVKLGKKSAPHLAEALGDGDWRVRRAAAEALGKLDYKEAAPRLAGLLGDEDWCVRRAAEEALVKIGQQAIQHLAKVLKDNKDPAARCLAAEALGKIGDKEAIAFLEEAFLKDKNWQVCESAAKALSKVGQELMKTEVVPFFIKALKNKVWNIRCISIMTLRDIGDTQAAPALIPLLRDENVSIRWLTAEALGKIGDTQAVPALISALKENTPTFDTTSMITLDACFHSDMINVHGAVADALGEIGDKRAIPSLRKALRDKQALVRQSAAEALDKLGWQRQTPEEKGDYFLAKQDWGELVKMGREAVPYLIDAVENPDNYVTEIYQDQEVYVRDCAAAALRKIGDPQGLEALKRQGMPTGEKEEKKEEKKDDKKDNKKDEGAARQSASGAAEETQKPESGAARNVKDLFDLVYGTINNNRTRWVKAANELVDFLDKRGVALPKIDKRNSTAKVMADMRRVLDEVAKLADVPQDVRLKAKDVEKNLVQLEADSIIASLIILARRAKRQKQRLIIGLETDWIPGIKERGYGTQYSAMQNLMKEIDSLGNILEGLGVEIIHKGASDLKDTVLARARETNTKLANIVILASQTTVAGFERELEGLGKEERPFLAAVDPTELEAYYKTMRNPSEELDIKITEILSIALELAAGKEMPNIPGIKYDEARRMAVFLPKAEPVDYDKELKARYDARLKALESA